MRVDATGGFLFCFCEYGLICYMLDAVLFENLDELRFHFNRSGEDIGDDDDNLAAALMRHLDEETFHSVHGTSMYLHSLPFGDVDFFGTHIGDLFITLVYIKRKLAISLSRTVR